MEFSFNFKLASYLIIAFIFFTIIGTLSHEFGHYIAGKSVGINTRINYKSTICLDKNNNKNFREIQILAKRYSLEKVMDKRKELLKRLIIINNKILTDYKIFTLGGPIQTLLTSIIGLIFLIYFRKSFYNSTILAVWQWLIIFISLFWLRQTANMFVGLFKHYILGSPVLNGDEIKLALYYGLPSDSILIATGLVGLVILVIIVFKFIPIKQRLTFLISGLVGGVAGYYLWLIQFGKYILP